MILHNIQKALFETIIMNCPIIPVHIHSHNFISSYIHPDIIKRKNICRILPLLSLFNIIKCANVKTGKSERKNTLIIAKINKNYETV